MLAKVEKVGGLKYLGFVGDRPSRMLTTSNRKVVKPEDLDGLKLRVPMVRSIKTFFEEMGAAPTPIPGAELYMALKQGVVDGQDNGWDAIVKASFYEVQNYVIETNYVRQGFIILGSAKTWNSLSKTEQKAILDAAIPTAEFVTEESNKIVASGKKFVVEKGVTVVKPDLEAFRSASVKVIQEKLDGKDWAAGLYDKIQAID
jgi:TRAP-type C4-dicarboxylate transport system substrate-binding protein